MRNKVGKIDNFELVFYDGDFPMPNRRLIGVPWSLTPKQRLKWEPYLNVSDERGYVGTLRLSQLRQLRSWLNRVNIDL